VRAVAARPGRRDTQVPLSFFAAHDRKRVHPDGRARRAARARGAGASRVCCAWRKCNLAKITGIGGVFLKCKGDSAALAAWYQKHLGMPLADFGGAVLRWPDDRAEDRGVTAWHLAGKDS